MGSRRIRWWLVGLALLALFTVANAVVIQWLPHPLSRADYLVVGSLATLVVLLVLFVVLALAGVTSGNGNYRSRRKP